MLENGRALRVAFGVAVVLSIAVASARVGQQAQAPAGLRLHVFDCGVLEKRDGVPYGLSLEQLPPRDLSNLCALVAHPRGTLLWETGLHSSVNGTAPGGDTRPGRPRAGDRVDRPLVQQLEAAGYRPADITFLAMSHAHWDHTGNVREFLAATWLVQRPEREAMFGTPAPPNRADFEALAQSRTQVLDGDHDVFGDGSVRLLFTPGHTAGHQALLVRLPMTGAVLLSGDLYHFPEELTMEPVATGRNAEQVKASKARVQSLIRETGAQLWIQHDVRGFAGLKKAPAFYD